jgi:hypothetical protein
VTSPHVMAFCTIDNYLHVDIPITTWAYSRKILNLKDLVCTLFILSRWIF